MSTCTAKYTSLGQRVIIAIWCHCCAEVVTIAESVPYSLHTLSATLRLSLAPARPTRSPPPFFNTCLQDHIGAAGLVADYFAADKPLAISSRRPRWVLKGKEKRDPNTVFGNNRGVPLPTWYQEEVLEVGGLRFALEKAHIHQAGDYLIHLDKNDPTNADAGTTKYK